VGRVSAQLGLAAPVAAHSLAAEGHVGGLAGSIYPGQPMTSLRTIVSFAALLAACKPDAPAQSKPATAEASPAKGVEGSQERAPGSLAHKRLPPDDPHAMPPPGEDSPAMEVVPSAKGTLEAMIDGKPAHFMHLSPGQNRAVALPGEGVGRVSIAGSEEDSGLPHLRIIIEGVRPDQIEYPLTMTSKPEKPAKGPSLSMRYEVNENRVYVIDPAKGADMQVTLEGWEGTALRGRFEGKLAATAAGLGAPISVSGKFTTTLTLSGVEPGATAAADSKSVP
jgi:hypothetical protein